MKRITFLVMLIPFWIQAQVPSYYNDVNLNLTGTSLKDELASKIISTHTNYLSYSEIWESSKITDLDPDDGSQSNVILIYGYSDTDGNYVTDRTRSKNANGGTAGTDWNREHTYPKSLGSPDLGTSGPGSDAHHLRPSDVTFNGQRSNKKFASGNGNAGDSNSGWYPGDEWKGDVARMMMYMYLRYGSQCLPTAVGIGSSSSTPDEMIDLFLQWNAEDAVSQIEKNRNSYHGTSTNTYAQGNRNPFIDNPAFATQIWGGPQAEDLFGSGGTPDTETPTVPLNLVASNITSSGFNLTWDISTDNVGVSSYSIYKDGTFLASSGTNTYAVTGLVAETSYLFSVSAKDSAGNESSQSSSILVTTIAGAPVGNGSEIFISEYVEGSSNNKAIEIANFTGATVDLSSYSLKRNTNGGSSWGAALNLSGQLISGEVFVAANSSSTSSILNVADLTSSSDAITFNGNDPVGLFKNNVLIDIVGNFNGGSANFAKDQTLRRVSSVTDPSTTYNTSEWESFSRDTFDGLGSHTTSGVGEEQDVEAPTSPSNVTASNITETTLDLSWDASTDNVGVVNYDVFKDGSLLTTITGTTLAVTSLSPSTSYSFVVVANDAAGNTSADSNSENVTTIDVTAPTVPSNLVASNITVSSLELSWDVSTDNVGVNEYTIYKDGIIEGTSSTNSFTISGLLSETTYSFTVSASDVAGNVSVESSSLSVITLSEGTSGGNGTEIFISEYVEGSSSNKAIEIANFTEATIDLSNYSLKRNVNGGTTWGAALSLSGQLISGDVFVIANSSATSTILNVADLTSSSDAIMFNGNDPVGLFKNNVLIDIVGNFNGGSIDFAKDQTLRRVSSVTDPSTTYNTSEWESFSTDTFDGLGSHTTTSGGGDTEYVSDIILEHSFETGWDGWTDGGSDCYRTRSSYSFDGDYSIRIRDNSGSQSAMTSSSYDISNYENLEIKFNFYSRSMETNEDFWLLYFDGSTWHTLQTYASGTDFSNGEFSEKTVNIDSSTFNFPANAQFKFQCDASANADEIYIDNVVVTASSGQAPVSAKVSAKIPLKESAFENESELIEIEEMNFYPNPSIYATKIVAEIDVEDDIVDVFINVVNSQGRLVESKSFKNIEKEYFEHGIDTSKLKSGLYFVNITTNKGLDITKKLIVK